MMSMPGTLQQTATIDVPREVTLLEAGIAALTVHAMLFAVIFALGLLGLLLSEIPELMEEPEIKFTFAPETETVSPEEATAPGTVPGAPQPSSEIIQEQASVEPVPQAPPPGPPVASLPPIMATPPMPIEELSDSPQNEAPSEGVEDAAEEVAEAIDDAVVSEALPAEEMYEAETEEAADDVLEATEESLVPEFDRGDLGTFQQPADRAPAGAPGRPEGPSLDQRISEFGRAVEFSRDQAASRPQEPRNSFEPDYSNLPTTGQAIGNITFESGDYDWEDYYRQIYWTIWRAWHNRLLARVDDFEKWAQQDSVFMLDHINGVRFTIERSGQIVDIVIERESGSEPFDLSSVEGLDESLLPPLPDDFPRESENVHVFFLGQGPVGSMRRSLQELKRAGWI